MKSGDLRHHSLALATLSATSYKKSQQWSYVREVLQDLSKNLNKFAKYLEKRNEAMKSRQSHLELRTDLDDLSILGSKSILPGPSARYNTLHERSSPTKQYLLMITLHQIQGEGINPMKCVKYVYTGSTNHLVFVWKVPIDFSETEVLNNSMNITNELKRRFLCTIQEPCGVNLSTPLEQLLILSLLSLE